MKYKVKAAPKGGSGLIFASGLNLIDRSHGIAFLTKSGGKLVKQRHIASCSFRPFHDLRIQTSDRPGINFGMRDDGCWVPLRHCIFFLSALVTSGAGLYFIVWSDIIEARQGA